MSKKKRKYITIFVTIIVCGLVCAVSGKQGSERPLLELESESEQAKLENILTEDTEEIEQEISETKENEPQLPEYTEDSDDSGSVNTDVYADSSEIIEVDSEIPSNTVVQEGQEQKTQYITPEEQKCIDAGYGTVVEMDQGSWYAVLMQSNKHTLNGKYGDDILYEYLKELGLHPKRVGGCWINPDKGWYWYTAEQIEKIQEDVMGDDFNWEDGEIEWH